TILSAPDAKPPSSCWLGLSSVLMLVWLSGRSTILSAPDAKPPSSCWLGLSSVLMLVWLSGRTSAPDATPAIYCWLALSLSLMLFWLPGRTSAPDVKPPPAVLSSVLGRDLPLPGPASVLMNSIPIVTQLDIFEPRQEMKGAVAGGWNLRLRNLRGVHPRIIRGCRADWRLRHEEPQHERPKVWRAA